MCGAIETLDEKGAKGVWINGILQIVAGGVSIIFQAAALYLADHALPNYTDYIHAGSGIWGGIFFVITGIVTLLAGVRRNVFGLIVASMTLQLINFIIALTYFFYVVLALNVARDGWHCYDWWWINPTSECTDWQYPVLVIIHMVLLAMAFAESISIIWTLILLCDAVHKRRLLARSKPDDIDGKPPTIAHVNFHATSGSVKANAIAQLTTTIISITVGIVILFVVAYGVGSGDGDFRPKKLQNSGGTLWCGAFFVLTSALGLKTARFGQNVYLILFLCLNVLGLILAPLEILGASLAINDRHEGMVVEDRKCDSSKSCNTFRSYRFVIPLIVLNAIIILAALVQFAFSIWGIVSASIALYRDGVCARCCSETNCFCDDRCGPSYSVGSISDGSPKTVPGTVQYAVEQGSVPGTLILVPQNAAGSLDPSTIQIATTNTFPPPAIQIPA